MRRLLFGLSLGLMFLFIGAYASYAEEMCGCMGKMREGMHERGMPMMEGMKHHGAGIMGREHGMWGRLKDLDLSDAQKEAIRDIKSREAKDTIRKRADIQIARIELKDILQKDAVDMRAAEAKLKQLEALRTDLRLSCIKTFEEIKAKLTPEQKKKLRSHPGRHNKWERGVSGLPGPEEQEG